MTNILRFGFIMRSVRIAEVTTIGNAEHRGEMKIETRKLNALEIYPRPLTCLIS